MEEGPGCFIQGVKEGSPWKQHAVARRVHGVCQVAWGTETLDEGPKSSPRPRDTHQDPLRRSRQTLPLHCPLTSVEAFGAHLPTKNSNRKANDIQVPDIQSPKRKFCFPVLKKATGLMWVKVNGYGLEKSTSLGTSPMSLWS